MKAEQGFIEVSGGRIFHEAAGSGPAVVLLHAGIADLRMWERQMSPFVAAGYRVVRFDGRGFGRSPDPTEPFSMVEEIGEVMSGLGIERAMLVGCSLGGTLALEFGLAYPERVAALVLVASGLLGFDWPPDPRREAADEAAAAGDFDRAASLAMEVWAPLRTDPEVDALIRRMVFDNAKVDALPDELFLMPEKRAIDHLADITAPTLIVEGDTDDPAIAQIASLLSAGIPNAEHVVIPNADHLVPLRNAEAFNREVLGFLAQACGF